MLARLLRPLLVIAGHSRSKNGVASARLCPLNPTLLSKETEDVDGRVKPGHDEQGKSYLVQKKTQTTSFVTGLKLAKSQPRPGAASSKARV
jgi:hypothetical protein